VTYNVFFVDLGVVVYVDSRPFQEIISAYVCGLIIMIFENISQGSVATHLRCGGIFDNPVIANFPQNVPVK